MNHKAKRKACPIDQEAWDIISDHLNECGVSLPVSGRKIISFALQATAQHLNPDFVSGHDQLNTIKVNTNDTIH